MNELKKLGEQLLDRSPYPLMSRGSGIARYDEMYIIQCVIGVDSDIYPTLEKATRRWLQLKFQGKI